MVVVVYYPQVTYFQIWAASPLCAHRRAWQWMAVGVGSVGAHGLLPLVLGGELLGARPAALLQTMVGRVLDVVVEVPHHLHA